MRALASGAVLREPERAKYYLLRIVRNLATDQARSRARVSVEPWAAVPEVRVGRPRTRGGGVARRRPGVPSAPRSPTSTRGHQEILHLRFVEELDYAAVAARLHTTEHAARQRVYRAMQALRTVAQRLQLGLDGS